MCSSCDVEGERKVEEEEEEEEGEGVAKQPKSKISEPIKVEISVLPAGRVEQRDANRLGGFDSITRRRTESVFVVRLQIDKSRRNVPKRERGSDATQWRPTKESDEKSRMKRFE
jgi:hypothetical protein